MTRPHQRVARKSFSSVPALGKKRLGIRHVGGHDARAPCNSGRINLQLECRPRLAYAFPTPILDQGWCI
jgi:hypothetical protein